MYLYILNAWEIISEVAERWKKRMKGWRKRNKHVKTGEDSCINQYDNKPETDEY